MTSECPTCLTPISATPTTKTPMASRCLQALRGLVTGRDNQTLDMGRLSWAGCSLAVLGLAAWHEHQLIHVPIKDLATSLSAIAVTHGAALGLKGKTEPGGDQ